MLALAEKEAGLVLTKLGQPVSKVTPIAPPATPRIAPLHPGAIETSADFDAPLPDDYWLGKT